jgi:hypothetical protein
MRPRVAKEPVRRQRRWRGAAGLLVVAMTIAVTGSSGLVAAAPQLSEGTFRWGPVTTIASHPSDGARQVTTDGGMTVAAWPGPYYRNLWVAARLPGQDWPRPTKIETTAAWTDLVKDGSGAWLIWQGFETVQAVRVSADGTIGSPEVVGPSSDPFHGGPTMAVGSNGAMAAVWRQDGDPLLLSYQPPGGQWDQPETVPVIGTLEGLVVGARGTAQLVVRAAQGLVYLRRAPSGTWSAPRVLATDAAWATVAGNQHGDLVVGWGVYHSDDTFSLFARYRPAESAFGSTERLIDSAPDGSNLELAMAGNGAVATVYRIVQAGEARIELTPADSAGRWLDTQALELTEQGFDLAMNDAGEYVVTTLGGGIHVVACSANNVCGDPQFNAAPRSHIPSITLGPKGAITLLWSRGCRSEACFPTQLLSQRGH